MTIRSTLRRLAALLALALVPVLSASAVDESDLLPVDQAFPLEAVATSRDRIEVRWKIVEGYYLYRHRMGAQVQGKSFAAQAFRLPDGEKHDDEFFGPVETYRTAVTGVLPGKAADGADRVQLQVKFQGCADLGICYPPQVRTLSVPLPPAGGAAPANAAATPSAAFSALGQSLGGASPGPSLIPGASPGAQVDRVPLPPVQAFRFEAIAADGDTLLLRWTPAPGYYLYRDRSSVRIEGDGVRAGKPRWPKGAAHRDEHFGDVVVFFDRIDVPLPLVRTQRSATGITVVATFQGCQTDGICYPPLTRRVKLALPSAPAAPVAAPAAGVSADEAARVAAAAATLDATRPPEADAIAGAGARGDTRAGDADPVVSGDAGMVSQPPTATRSGAPDASAGNALRSTPPAPPAGGLLGAWLLGLLGGLLLNLMPCVLPILSLKVVGLVQSGDRARSHALWYTAGVLVAFAAVGGLAIALRATGQALGWGFQLQTPWFVAVLAYLMFAVGLGLSGVVTLGGGLGRMGQTLATRGGRAGDFFTGVLACVVASPCIAPFMGGALAFAFTASAPVALSVFLALGLGLALPFLVIGFVPAFARLLPAPGAWMETLKQVMAFPMYLTAIWLAWVLGKQRGVDAMALVAAGIGVFALALWVYERSRWRGSSAGRAIAFLLLLAALVPIWGVTRLQPPAAVATHADGTVPYSAERLAALRKEGRPVFVNMTADWCVTCKANERSVFSGDAFRTAMTRADAVYMVGDWTNVDEEIGRFLKAHNAVGVPLYVVYPRTGGDGEVLPALLTDAIVRDALGRAAR